MAPDSPSSKEFIPTDDELLQVFLYNKVHDKPVPTYLTILEYDLYGVKNPWDIWEEFGGSHSYGGKDLYFFTTLKKKFATSSRVIRTIGLGSWEGEDTGKFIFAKDTNKLLGIKKRFRFEKSDTYHDGGWILHEYSLHASVTSVPSGNNNVLCRFRKNVKYDPRNTGMGNTWQATQRRTMVLERAITTKSRNNILLREDICQESRNQPNDVDNRTKVVETTIRIESEYKEEEDGVRNTNQEDIRVTTQRRTIVLGLAATTESDNKNVCLGKNISQRSRKQPDGGDKTDFVETTARKNCKDNKNVCLGENIAHGSIKQPDGGDKTDAVETIARKKCKVNKEEDGALDMSWPEYFSLELRRINEGCLIKEEEISMLPNEFYKDLLLENIDMKYINGK